MARHWDVFTWKIHPCLPLPVTYISFIPLLARPGCLITICTCGHCWPDFITMLITIVRVLTLFRFSVTGAFGIWTELLFSLCFLRMHFHGKWEKSGGWWMSKSWNRPRSPFSFINFLHLGYFHLILQAAKWESLGVVHDVSRNNRQKVCSKNLCQIHIIFY